MILDDLADYLVAKGVIARVDRYRSPATTESDGSSENATESVALVLVPGREGERHIGETEYALERPHVQVQVRADDPARSEQLAGLAYVALSKVRNQILGATWYMDINALQPPFQLREDAQGRMVFAFNVEVQKAP